MRRRRSSSRPVAARQQRIVPLSTAGAVAALAILSLCRPAAAKSQRVVDYRYQAVWSTAVRLLRVDRGYPITDKDRENGYILFTFPGEGRVKKCPASLELVPFVDERGFRRLRIQVNIAHQPSYIEVHLIDGLLQKLREERGEPPPPKRAPRAPKDKGKKGDGGDGTDSGEGKKKAKKRRR